jgi:hypothetical protein
MVKFFIALLFFVLPFRSISQEKEDVVFGRVSTTTILRTIEFDDQISNVYDVIRIDNMGSGISNPVIFSSAKVKLVNDPRLPDTVRLDSQSLKIVKQFIRREKAFFHGKRVTGYGIYRVTYRLDGIVEQYYVDGGKHTSRYFRDFAKLLGPMGTHRWLIDRFYLISESVLGN